MELGFDEPPPLHEASFSYADRSHAKKPPQTETRRLGTQLNCDATYN